MSISLACISSFCLKCSLSSFIFLFSSLSSSTKIALFVLSSFRLSSSYSSPRVRIKLRRFVFFWMHSVRSRYVFWKSASFSSMSRMHFFSVLWNSFCLSKTAYDGPLTSSESRSIRFPKRSIWRSLYSRSFSFLTFLFSFISLRLRTS